jgi:hypothetical protein
MRSLHYLNGGTLSPFPTEPEHCHELATLHPSGSQDAGESIRLL